MRVPPTSPSARWANVVFHDAIVSNGLRTHATNRACGITRRRCGSRLRNGIVAFTPSTKSSPVTFGVYGTCSFARVFPPVTFPPTSLLRTARPASTSRRTSR